ncbi:MAG: hypothetical protein ACLUOF_10170 [Ruminococcus sp.]
MYSFAVQALSGSIRRVADQVGGYPEHYICHRQTPGSSRRQPSS